MCTVLKCIAISVVASQCSAWALAYGAEVYALVAEWWWWLACGKKHTNKLQRHYRAVPIANWQRMRPSASAGHSSCRTHQREIVHKIEHLLFFGDSISKSLQQRRQQEKTRTHSEHNGKCRQMVKNQWDGADRDGEKRKAEKAAVWQLRMKERLED